MAPVNIASVTKQLSEKGVPFKCASDPDWAAYSSSYNIRLPFTPAVVVLPHEDQQIEHALACAREHGLKVQARSGGHSYASHSVGGVDGAMVIDMRQFQLIQIQGDHVVVNSGVRIGNLAKAIYEVSGWKQALPHGTCARVGLGGHLTHGGFGMFSRAWGLAMDRIIAMTVITADGKCVYCDNKQNGDLFYVSFQILLGRTFDENILANIRIRNKAMRGAGDSFGIVKSFYLNPEPAPNSVLHWSISINDVTKSVKRAMNALKQVQKVVHNPSVVDRQLGVQLSFSSNHFSIDGSYLGPVDTLEHKILPALLSKIPEDNRTMVIEYDWLESIRSFNQGQDIATDPSSMFQEHLNFFAKSVVVPEPGFTQKAMHSFFTYLLNEGARAPVGYFILFDLYGGNDSKIHSGGADFSAFAHRNACWVIQLHGYTGNNQVFPQEGIDFITGLANSITSVLPNCGAYANYTDPTLSREEAHKLYFGDMSKILWKLKKKWDPDNLFHNPQSILAD
ncbi:putative glucooligosaccharide oxidase [Annulohypoxylon moriforme]|nr:putative glucooligosaccharide oxidase [Annulohypoxylon moriforme]